MACCVGRFVSLGGADTPTAAIIDSQSVKTSCNVSESSQGIDAGKKIKGRKRHSATDVLGLLLVVTVTATSVQDSTAGQQVLDRLAVEHPSVTATGGGWWPQQRRHPSWRPTRHPGRRRQTPYCQGIPGPATSLGGRAHAGLAEAAPPACARLRNPPSTLSRMIHWAMTNIMSRILTRESTQTWRIGPLKPDITT
jgi:hypothetical protein